MVKWTQTKLAAGTIVGQHYEIEQALPGAGNAGGLGGVYSATHKFLDRRFAVHVMALPSREQERSEVLDKVVRAAREAEQIIHPNVLRLYEVGDQVQGHPCFYMVTDMIDGIPLRAHIKRHRAMERPRAMRLFIGALNGLQEFHSRGMVHQSLKPSTLFMANPGTLDERLMVMYMGMSHLEHRLRESLVSAGRSPSSPRHQAPEWERSRHLDTSGDVYQTALVLVQMLVGDLTISGHNALDRIRQHLQQDVTISQALHLGELGTILEKALHQRPDSRHKDAAALSRALCRLEGMPTPHDGVPTGKELTSGTVLAEVYEIREEIGRGGFAVVYGGVQRGINRPVAIKVLTVKRPMDQALDEYEARFLREARAAASIDHANVVTIHHFGLIDDTGQPYMVMERLQGHDLEEELERHGPMDPERALPLVCNVLDALGEAHRQKIVHKDLKPSNLFLVRDRRNREVMKITDFGIARLMAESEERITRDGRPVCTPSYAAPEYVQDLLATPALDVYQMALVLVEMLTGKPVVDADTVLACIRIHMSGKLKLPSKLLLGPLGPILRKALAVNHLERYPDADSFLDDLSKINPSEIEI